MYKRFIIIVCGILVVFSLILIIFSKHKKRYPTIDVYNNNVFTEEMYQKVTKIAMEGVEGLPNYKDDPQGIHDAFAILAGLKLSEYKTSNGLYGFSTYRIYIEGEDEPIYLSVESDNIMIGHERYALDIDFRDKLRSVLMAK